MHRDDGRMVACLDDNNGHCCCRKTVKSSAYVEVGALVRSFSVHKFTDFTERVCLCSIKVLSCISGKAVPNSKAHGGGSEQLYSEVKEVKLRCSINCRCFWSFDLLL